MPRRLVIALAVAVLGSLVGDARAACADAHIVMFFDGLPAEAASRPLYWAVEGTGGTTNVRFRVVLFGGDCSGNPVSVTLSTEADTANTLDYVPQNRELVFPNTGTHDDFVDIDLPVTGDATPEGLEWAHLVLSAPKGGAALSRPSRATVAIVDDDGPPQVSLVAGSHEQFENRGDAGVPVFRSGSVALGTSVGYTVAPGGPNPASAGQDYQAAPSGTLEFAAGQRVAMIPIALVRDGVTEPDEHVAVSISGAEVSGTSSVTLTILDAAGAPGPVSSLHHPRQKLRYRANDYRIREVHVFTRGVGPPVVDARFALRRNMKGRSCAWLVGKRFKKGPCRKERWLKTKRYEPDFFYYRMKAALTPTGGRIRSYTAFSRAEDGAGQVESSFQRGRNANTFKVRRPKKK